MWCPNCKYEYVEGITTCPDCGAALVEELAKDAEDANAEVLEMDVEETAETADADTVTQVSNEKPAHAYISKKAKAEDLQSTAYTFTLVSLIGIVVLVLFIFDVFPFVVADYMKVLISVVMGAMFLIFLAIGIRSFTQLKGLKQAAGEEEALADEILDWFHHTYDTSDFDDAATEELGEEQLYFKRYAVMEQFIRAKYPDLEESFLDHIIETLYNKLF